MSDPTWKTKRIPRLVVGVDGSPESEVALRTAIHRLSMLKRGELHLVHAAPTPVPPPSLTGDAGSAAVGAAHAKMLHDLPERYAKHVVATAHALGLTPRSDDVDVHICVGSADEAILRVAREVGADLIVVGCHGRRGLSRMFLGSVAELVVRKAECPVLVARPDPYPRDHELPDPPREHMSGFDERDPRRPLAEGFHYHARQKVRWVRDNPDTAGLIHP